MTQTALFKSAHDLRRNQMAASSAVLPREMAYTLPIPKNLQTGIVIQVLFYSETGPMNQRTVHLPGYAMYLSPTEGRVLRFWAIRPEEAGITEPLQTVPGAGIDPPTMTGMEFFHLRQRLLDISAEVWEAYASGKIDFDNSKRVLIREYLSIFLRITKKEVAPFYVMSSPDFFNWLQTVSKAK